jgi:hypothetical protein
LFPMDETMPIPVMTTRLMISSPIVVSVSDDHQATSGLDGRSCHSCSLVRRGILLEQTDLQVLGSIDNLAIGRKPPVGDPQHKL